jgi:DNA replication protein DnaC
MSPKKTTNSPDSKSHDYRATILKSIETLKIKMAPEELDSLVRDATEKGMSPWELLDRFLKSPANQSVQRSIERRIANAGLPTTATLEAFDWEFNAKTINKSSILELASGEFIKRRDNLAFVGQSGLGKSHIIQGVARACCALGYRVRYETSASLLEELMRAAGAKTLPSALRYYRSFDLLIIDEFGFDKLERREYPESPSMLYKVVDSRNGRGSTAFLTNVDFGDWTEYLGDPALVMALLDRVSDNAIIFRFEGKSYRKSRTKQAT